MRSLEKTVGPWLPFVLAGMAACANGVESGSSRQDSVAVQAQALYEVDCADEDQAALLAQASADAQAALFDARLEVSALGGGGDSSNFENWFGSPADEARVARITNIIEMALSVAQTITLQCSCPAGTDPTILAIEHTPGNRTDPIAICPAYFDKSQPYREINVGVLIHEYMHAGGGLSDLQTGVPCEFSYNHELAGTEPDVAAVNPENHRLFALHWQPDEPSGAAYCH